jgi:Protein of unknown function (DUF2853)
VTNEITVVNLCCEAIAVAEGLLLWRIIHMAIKLDHIAAVRKYVTKVDEAALTGMAKNYALVLSKPDTQLVAASDPAEVQRVVDNFLKKKLGRKESNEVLLEAAKAVGVKMKEDRSKSRLAFYYILAEQYGALGMFHPKKK